MIIKLDKLSDIFNKYNYFLTDTKNTCEIDCFVRKYMEEKKVKIKTLAENTGISRQTLYLIAQGEINPGIDYCLKISEALNVPVNELFKLNENSWCKPVKIDGLSCFLDFKYLEIIDFNERKSRVKKEKDLFYDSRDKVTLTKEEYENLKEKFLEENFKDVLIQTKKEYPCKSEKSINKLAKDNLLLKFSDRYFDRFQKLAEKLHK
ncbi:XRE family transcriptional regulator [Clostridium perfringens]